MSTSISDTEAPDFLSINLTWSQSDQSQILTILTMIPSKFKLSEMFSLSPGMTDKIYYFKGMIWFWGLHYFWYIRHVDENGETWIEFNDEYVNEMSGWHFIGECEVVGF